MGIDGAVETVAQQRTVVVREAVGIHALALDQPGVAVGSLLRGAAPVDQHYGPAPFLQVKGTADADDAGPENHDIRAHPLF
jgi:hypothetical protein